MYTHPFRSGAYVMVDAAVLRGVFAHRQTRPDDTEAGGILVGLRRGEHMHVTGFTSPGPQDRRARTGFHRARRYHQAQALNWWRRSGGLVDYLGEWHTHPEARPSPSATDLREWRLLLQRYERPLAFMIAGTRDEWWLGVGQTGHVRQAWMPQNRSRHG